MINLKQALLNPSSVFSAPIDVLLNTSITREQKIEILKHWESDMREVFVAEEENMLGKGVLKMFEQIREALHTLDAKIDIEETPPTKQGG
jgi:hypothetical protein